MRRRFLDRDEYYYLQKEIGQIYKLENLIEKFDKLELDENDFIEEEPILDIEFITNIYEDQDFYDLVKVKYFDIYRYFEDKENDTIQNNLQNYIDSKNVALECQEN